MIRMRFFRKLSAIVILMAALFAGCRSSAPPVEFYTLTSLSAEAKKADSTAAASNIAVGIGPVQIPRVLDRPQIVTRAAPNKIMIDEFHRWAAPLETDFAQVLAQNISFLLPTDKIAVYPWGVAFRPNYRIALDIRYFEGQWGKNVILDVVWRVTDPADQNTLASKKSVITEPLPTEDYEALVAAQSQALAQLSREIVQEIRNLHSAKN